jgi:CheY-like chemotaxis protein
MRLLVVEDEARLGGAEALWLATEADYGTIVLDVMLPSVDGLEVTRRLRAGGRWAPVLLLTARDGIHDRVVGLDGDDLTSPPGLRDPTRRRAGVRDGRRLGFGRRAGRRVSRLDGHPPGKRRSGCFISVVDCIAVSHTR